jgi:hypothetical protein
MEDPSTAPPAPARWTSADWLLLGLLVLLAAGIRVWQLAHTEVAARDSIGFIRIAWQLHQHPLTEWPGVLRHAEQHPAYPLTVLAASVPLRALHLPEADHMRLSAQLASALAAVLLVLPLFCLGRDLFDRRVGFGAAALVQCLPVSGRILADGLSEAVFLLFATSALLWSCRALRRPRAGKEFVLAGLFGGLAYLTRPEGLLIVLATGLVLLVSQAVEGWRRTRRDWLLCGSTLSLSAAILAVPFMVLTGHLTVKPAGNQILTNRPPPGVPSESAAPAPGPRILLATYHVYEKRPHRAWWGLRVLVEEIVKGSFYLGGLAALVGLWGERGRRRRDPGTWMMLLVCLGVGFALWRVAVVIGYLSDRHTLLILVCGSFWAVAGLMTLGQGLARRLPRLRFWAGEGWAIALPLLFAAAALPKTLQPLHEYRSGFREVGYWLAEHTRPIDQIIDPLCWAHYYAGRVFLEGSDVPLSPGCWPRQFVVLEDAGNRHDRLWTYKEAERKVAGLDPVFRWPCQRGHQRAEILVYELPLIAQP